MLKACTCMYQTDTRYTVYEDMCNIVGENSNPVYYVGDVTKVKDAKVAVYTCDFDAMGTETKVLQP